MTPLVGLGADFKFDDEQPFHCCGNRYVQAISSVCECLPVIIPALGHLNQIDAYLERLDGLVLTGSVSNVHPSEYGEAPSEEHEPYDQTRDQLTLALAQRAAARGLPLLAICRGFQELNVAFGGSLHPAVHSVAGRLDHRARGDNWDEKYGPRHNVELAPGSTFAKLLDAQTIAVNTLHRQAIDRLAPGLIAEGHASDGTIEAVRVADATGFALGVQWHPEFRVMDNAISLRLFRAFATAVRAYHHRTDRVASVTTS